MPTAEQQRLDRIEAKIDKLVDTVIALARAEEKLINLEEDIKTLVKKHVEHEDVQEAQEKRIVATEGTLGVIRNVFWIIVSCVLTTVVAYYVTDAMAKRNANPPPATEIHAPAKP